MPRSVGVLLALWCCLQVSWAQGEPSCDTSQIPFGCTTNIAANVLVSVAADAPAILPLQVTHSATDDESKALVVARLSATHSPRVAVELTAWDTVANATSSSTIETHAAGKELWLRSPGGSIVLEQGSARITIDGETGCILINGTLPAKSPCRETIATPTIATPPNNNGGGGGGGSTTQDKLSEPLITGWMLAVVIIATLILGCLGGCFVGMWIYKKRLRPMSTASL